VRGVARLLASFAAIVMMLALPLVGCGCGGSDHSQAPEYLKEVLSPDAA
jgi:hypothetical protein